MADLGDLLANAKTVEVLDWPGPEVPAALARAGYKVVAPAWPPPEEGPLYLSHEVSDGPVDPDEGTTAPLADGSRLIFRPLDALPEVIDIVSTYRPADEQPAIVEEAIRLGAKAVWVEPGETVSEEARAMAEAAGLLFIDGRSIVDAVR